eukprot:scaffold111088_cov45-Phaeocystis_antarctica.AAC.1
MCDGATKKRDDSSEKSQPRSGCGELRGTRRGGPPAAAPFIRSPAAPSFVTPAPDMSGRYH